MFETINESANTYRVFGYDVYYYELDGCWIVEDRSLTGITTIADELDDKDSAMFTAFAYIEKVLDRA